MAVTSHAALAAISLLAWLLGNRSQDCWDEVFTFEVCCGKPPKRKDCWTGPLNEESCCHKTEKLRQPGEKKKRARRIQTIERRLKHISSVLHHGCIDGCINNTLRRAFLRGPDAGTAGIDFLRWWEKRWERELRGPSTRHGGSSARRLEINLLHLILMRQPMGMSRTHMLWDRFVEGSHFLWMALWSRSKGMYHRQQVHAATLDSVMHCNGVAEPEPSKQLQSSKNPGGDDPGEAVHIAMVASIGKPPFGRKAMAGIRSALFFAVTRPLCFHLLVDSEGEADVRGVLATLEPWLRLRGRFQFYRSESLISVWNQLHTMLSHECLYRNPRYGSPGWLRLFAHEIIQDERVKAVVWVDAGDYVFLDDPARLMDHHREFSQRHVAGAPIGHPLPFQIFDLPRMRKANWTALLREVVQAGEAREGSDFCVLGEGMAVRDMAEARYKYLWSFFPSTWAFEPWEEWMPGDGVIDMWTRFGSFQKSGTPGAKGSKIWFLKVYPGLHSYMSMRVYCPELPEVLGGIILKGGGTETETLFAWDQAKVEVLRILKNISFMDKRGQKLQCNQRVQGVHFVWPFHFIPWVHTFLNYWAGSNVWGKHREEQRDLRVSSSAKRMILEILK